MAPGSRNNNQSNTVRTLGIQLPETKLFSHVQVKRNTQRNADKTSLEDLVFLNSVSVSAPSHLQAHLVPGRGVRHTTKQTIQNLIIRIFLSTLSCFFEEDGLHINETINIAILSLSF